MVVLETKRLLLRHFNNADVEAMCGIFQDNEVMRFSEGVRTTQEIRYWIDQNIETNQSRPGWGALGVVEKKSAKLIGYCGLFFFKDICGQPETEIGYRLMRSFWGKGYATEAAQAMGLRKRLQWNWL